MWLFKEHTFWGIMAWLFGAGTANEGIKMVKRAAGEPVEDDEEEEEEEVTEESQETEAAELTSLAAVQRRAGGDNTTLREGAIVGVVGVVLAVLLFCAGSFVSWGGWLSLLKILLWSGGALSTFLGGWWFVDAVKSRFKLDPLDAEIAEACKAVGSVSDDIAAPLSQAIAAYVNIRQMGESSAWHRARFPVKKYVQQARAQLLSLLERGQQLGRVAARLQRFEGQSLPAHYQKLADLYQPSCAQLATAAERFEEAEAEMSRALLAVTGKALTAPALEEPLREMTITFDALAETLESLEKVPALPRSMPKPVAERRDEETTQEIERQREKNF
jgi:hypothetical protein